MKATHINNAPSEFYCPDCGFALIATPTGYECPNGHFKAPYWGQRSQLAPRLFVVILATIMIIAAMIIGTIPAKAQFYGSITLGFVPYHNAGYFNGQLTIGRTIGRTFLEYNQTSAMTNISTVPSYFQVRGGMTFPMRNGEWRIFAGGGVRPAYYNEPSRIMPVYTYGIYLMQNIDDFYLKPEIAMNNRQLMPSIGFGSYITEHHKKRHRR